MKILLDTNVLISALIFGGRTRQVLLRLIGSKHEVYVSDYIVKEFSDKVYLKWPDQAERVMELFYMLPFEFCGSSKKLLGTLRDKKDEQVLSDALYHEIDIILTGDKDFLEAELEKPLIYSIPLLEAFLMNSEQK